MATMNIVSSVVAKLADYLEFEAALNRSYNKLDARKGNLAIETEFSLHQRADLAMRAHGVSFEQIAAKADRECLDRAAQRKRLIRVRRAEQGFERELAALIAG